MIQPLQFQNVNFCGANKDSRTNGEIPDISGKLDDFNREAGEVTESVAQTTETITRAVGQVGTSAVGIWAIFKNPVKTVVEFFSKVVKDEAGNVCTEEVIDKKTGQKILDEAGKVVTKVVKTADWKKLGIAGAIVGGVLAAIGAGIAIKKHNDKSEINQADCIKTSEPVEEALEETEKPDEE